MCAGLDLVQHGILYLRAMRLICSRRHHTQVAWCLDGRLRKAGSSHSCWCLHHDSLPDLVVLLIPP